MPDAENSLAESEKSKLPFLFLSFPLSTLTMASLILTKSSELHEKIIIILKTKSHKQIQVIRETQEHFPRSCS